MGPLAALRRPVPSTRVEPSPCPFQAFLGRTLRGMIVPNPLRPMEAIPLCPITGFPLSAAFSPSASGGLSACGVPLLGLRLNVGAIEHFGLWVSPCGLAFFEPMLAGDADFYLDLYRKGESHRILTAPGLARAEFRRVAELVQPGDKVLDVGCGEGGLARHLPHATYVGLDPIFSPVAEGTDVRNETIAEHAASHSGQYDAVCAFHVIEHVTDPLGFGRDLVQCTRPGGRIYIAVPV